MPLLRIQTNLPEAEGLAAKGADLIAEHLDKPRDFIQVGVETGCALVFAGSDAPNAFVEVRSLDLSPARAKQLAAAFSALLEEDLQIPPERVFINFFDVPRKMWGWNGSTFG